MCFFRESSSVFQGGNFMGEYSPQNIMTHTFHSLSQPNNICSNCQAGVTDRSWSHDFSLFAITFQRGFHIKILMGHLQVHLKYLFIGVDNMYKM